MDDKTDPWEAAQQSSYSRTKFYTRSRDEKGFSGNQQIKVSPHIHGVISELVESKKLPMYRVSGDFIRDALVHRAKDVREMLDSDDPLIIKIDAAIHLENKIQMVEEARIRMEGYQKLLADAESTLKLAFELQDIATLNHLLDNLEQTEHTLPPPYSDKMKALTSHYWQQGVGQIMPWKGHPLAAIEMPAIGGGDS